MKKLSHSAIAATLAALGANSVYADQTSHVYGIHDRSANHFAFTNATVLVEPGKSIKNATLVIDNGRVVSVKANGKIPAGATEIDLTSHTVYPGFIDPYSNYVFSKDKPAAADPNQGPKYQGDRKGGNAWNNAIHSEVNWVSEFKADKKSAESYIKNGFTSVQTAKMDGIFQGQGLTVSLGQGLPNDLIYNAHASHFGSFDKGSSKQEYPSSLMGSIALIRQSLSDANWYQKAQGKTDNLNTGQPVEYNAALQSLAELKYKGIMFNADDYLSTLRADKLFDQYGVSASYVADGHEYARINEIKNVNATFVLPLSLPGKPDVTSFESQLDVSLAELRHWERAPSNAAVLAKNNVPFAFTQFGLKKSSDLWGKVKTLIKHGLSEKDALAALTTVPAKLAGVSSKAGQLKSGMIADFVITDGNIFKDGKIKSVWMQGNEKSFSPIAPISFAGNYELKIAGESLSLELTEKDNKVSGEFVKGEDKAKVKVSLQSDNNLQFNADLSELGLNGVYRLSSRLNEETLSGFVLNEKAERMAFSGQRKAAEDKEDEKKSETKESVEYLSQVTFPNRAFGLSKAAKQQNVHIKNATVWTSEKAGILKDTDLIIRKDF